MAGAACSRWVPGCCPARCWDWQSTTGHSLDLQQGNMAVQAFRKKVGNRSERSGCMKNFNTKSPSSHLMSMDRDTMDTTLMAANAVSREGRGVRPCLEGGGNRPGLEGKGVSARIRPI